MSSPTAMPTSASADESADRKLVKTLLHLPPRSDSVAIAMAVVATITAVTVAGWRWPIFGALLPVSGAKVVEQFEYWRPWTACFAHADLAHLLSNMFMFAILARFLGGHFGYWIFPFWVFFLGGIANLIVLPSYLPEVQVLGASGVVNVLGGIWLSLFFFVSRQYRWKGRILRTLGVGLLLFAPQEFRPQVAERVHMAGLFLGIAFGSMWFLVFKNRIRSYEVWETVLADEPGDDLPPTDGLVGRESSSNNGAKF